MKLKQCILSFNNSFSIVSCTKDKAFTMLDMLVGLVLMTIIMGMVVTNVYSHKQLYAVDLASTRINQDLRGILDLIGSQIRLAGENLPEGFPAFYVENGSSGAFDSLTLRRNLLDESLKLCIDVDSGSTTNNLKFSQDKTAVDPKAGCNYSSNTTNYNSWSNYYNQYGPEIKAYIFNSNSKEGEFFIFDEVKDNSVYYRIRSHFTNPAWTNTYSVKNGSIYILEEWKIQLVNGVLQLIENQDTSNIKNIAYNISNIEIEVLNIDGSIKTQFTKNDNWTTVKAVRISLTGQEAVSNKIMSKTWTAQYGIRNVMSF